MKTPPKLGGQKLTLVNILLLSSSFLSCSFNWVRREANGIAHALAKFIPSPKATIFVCNISSLPSCVRDAWRLDCGLVWVNAYHPL
jgi:hypothetical protein